MGAMDFDGGVFGQGAAEWQFYPTPEGLADRAWGMFNDKHVERLLDACAGTGALAEAYLRHVHRSRHYHRDDLCVDAVEIDARHHPLLREKGIKVVGLDFAEFESGAIYSHVILNPPFAQGAKHALKAYDMLWEGEVVAILNAETIRNPFSAERRRLCSLIESTGRVEFVEDAFKGEGVEREAAVEIALVHLVKEAESNDDWIGPVIDSLGVDKTDLGESDVFRVPTELTLPNGFVQNQCIAFRQAVKAMREQVRAAAVATHFANRIGQTMAEASGKVNTDAEKAKMLASANGVRASLREKYLELKDRAWTSVLRSTETLNRLSMKVQKQAESQFKDIAALEFNEVNVHGFLLGLVESQPEMQIDMACDVFDQITKYWSDNTTFYRGWLSNDRHRTNGMRIRTTRFILPGHSTSSYQSSLGWESNQLLADFDKVFAMLDGKQRPDFGLVQLFSTKLGELRNGKRLASDYFEVRYYAMAGTIHFFARDKKLVDRLNKIVGRRRAWLPPAQDESEAFWKAYDKSEKLDGEVREEVKKLRREKGGGVYSSRYADTMREAMYDRHEGNSWAKSLLAEAIGNVLQRHGLLEALTHEESQRLGLVGQQGQLLLEA
jgi:predicted RNA methylase